MKWVLLIVLATSAIAHSQVTIGKSRVRSPAKPTTQPLLNQLRADAPDYVRTWLEAQPELRKEQLKVMRFNLKYAQRHRRDQSRRLKEELSDAEKDKDRLVYPTLLRASSGIYETQLRAAEVGAIGTFYDSLYVVSIPAPGDALAEGLRDWVWLSGIDTTNLVDGKQFSFTDPVVIIGTKQYESPIGVKTVWHVKRFNLTEYLVPAATQPTEP